MKDLLRRRATAVAAVAIVITGVLAVASDAGHGTSPASVTGCLKTSNGTLTRLAVGDSPLSPCPLGNVVVHLSGGDVTAVTAGTGLSGGGSGGALTLDVDFGDFGSCLAGSAIRVNGVTATCEPDDDTTYSEGSGLTLTGTTFAADFSAVQALVSGACSVGSGVRQINADGTVVCEPDDDTTYAAGTGLTLTGDTFDVDFAQFGSCPAGSAIRVVAGSATCEADDNTTYTAGAGLTLAGTTFAADLNVVQQRVEGTCAVGSAIREITIDGLAVCEPIPPASSAGGELLLIQRHEFDANATYFNLDTPGAPGMREWEVIETGAGEVIVDPDYPGYQSTSALTLHTIGGDGSAIVHGNRQASVEGGTLIFKAHVLDAYAEAGFVYGNRQPRGLAGGGDRELNAIEFVNTTEFNTAGHNTGVACRTVADGNVTETAVSLDQWTRRPAYYQIVARADHVEFYVNGVFKCEHSTNIPLVPLNLYFGTSTNTGNIPLVVDWASLEFRPN